MPLKICRSWCALVVVALFAAPLPAVAGDVAPEHHRVSMQVLDISFCAREEIVDTEHFMPLPE